MEVQLLTIIIINLLLANKEGGNSMGHYFNILIETFRIKKWKTKNNEDFMTLKTLREDLKELKGGK